ncbi:MAG TPA: alpha/beta hydrolase, partial [Flavisolibacter sp.]|nr:alpha/beta hydrolase [Flavisolibacter sp.]
RITLPPQYAIHYIDWIKPEAGETLNAYAQRLTQFIDTTQAFALVGLSFGGMIATAMTAFVRPTKTILLSSIGCARELPWYFRLAGGLRLYKLLPQALLNRPTELAHWLFGAKSKTERKALSTIIADADPYFVRWAIGAILTWKDKQRPPHLYHIHGGRDKILPLHCTQPDVVIEKGSHFMVWTHAGKISKALEEALAPAGLPEGKESQDSKPAQQ